MLNNGIEILKVIEKYHLNRLGISASDIPDHLSNLNYEDSKDQYANYMDSVSIEEILLKMKKERTILKEKYPPPTELQNTNSYYILAGIENELRSKLELNKILLPSSIIGTLPIGTFNALCTQYGNENYIILFNNGVFSYLNRFIKILILSVSQKYKIGNDSVISPLASFAAQFEQRATPEIQFRFEDLIGGYVLNGNPSYALQYFSHPDDPLRFTNLLNDAEIFMLSHEYAHIMLGHFNDKNPSPTIIKINEFDADRKGFELLLKTLPDSNTKGYALMAVNLMFLSLYLVQKAIVILLYGPDGLNEDDSRFDNIIANGYPKFRERIRKLEEAYLVNSDPSYNNYSLLSDCFFSIMNMWKLFEPKLLELHNKGIRPHKSLLPENLTHLGHLNKVELKYYHIKSIVAGISSENLTKFFIPFLNNYSLAVPRFINEGLVSDDKDLVEICKQFLFKVGGNLYENNYDEYLDFLKKRKNAGLSGGGLMQESQFFFDNVMPFIDKYK